MSRLRNIPETCPIYNDAKDVADTILDTVDQWEHDEEITFPIAEEIRWSIRFLLESTDRCRDISGELREMCVERGEKIEELEEKLGDLISA
jgi:uncharacterized coiled-coil DUF342 family protein